MFGNLIPLCAILHQVFLETEPFQSWNCEIQMWLKINEPAMQYLTKIRYSFNKSLGLFINNGVDLMVNKSKLTNIATILTKLTSNSWTGFSNKSHQENRQQKRHETSKNFEINSWQIFGSWCRCLPLKLYYLFIHFSKPRQTCRTFTQFVALYWFCLFFVLPVCMTNMIDIQCPYWLNVSRIFRFDISV